MTIISEQKQFIFIHNYKTAGTSIADVLRPYNDLGISLGIRKVLDRIHNAGVPVSPIHFGGRHYFREHARAQEVRDCLGADKFDSLFSFGFVRNPWDFHVSLYHYERQITRRNSQLHQTRSFAEYIDQLSNRSEHEQWRFVFSDDRKPLVSYIGRFERLSEELEQIGRQINICFSGLRHINSSVHEHYRTYYTQRMADRVAEIFRADIEAFDYSF